MTKIQGKLPPQNIEIEEAVLGALLLEYSNLDEVLELLHTPEIFYKEEHKLIFSAIQNVAFDGLNVDMLTVVNELTESGNLTKAGGAFGIAQLVNSVVSTASALSHTRILVEKYMQRELIKTCSRYIQQAYESDDVFSLLDRAEYEIGQISENINTTNPETLEDVLPSEVERMEQLRKTNTEISGIDMGYPTLNSKMNGWNKTDLVILGARPAMGKTAFALNLALNAVKSSRNTSVIVFSLEMGKEQLLQRFMSNDLNIPLQQIKRPAQIDQNGWLKICTGKLSSNNRIYVDDRAGINTIQIKSKIKALLRNEKKYNGKNGDWIVFIDYLQLMQGVGAKNKNREQVIASISRELKCIAKELKVPIIALSQLSRALEQRGEKGKVPQLSDLRESGAIEQDADIVMFLHRPEYYGIVADENGNSLEGLAMVNIAKFRNGSTDTIHFLSELKYQRFIDITEATSEAFDNNITQAQEQAYAQGKGITKRVQFDQKDLDIFKDDLPF